MKKCMLFYTLILPYLLCWNVKITYGETLQPACVSPDSKTSAVSIQTHILMDGREQFFHFCSGSLITSKWVLTTASCFTSNLAHGLCSEPCKYYVVFPQANITSLEAQRYLVRKFIVHKDFKTANDETNAGINDIALLELDQNVNINRLSQVQSWFVLDHFEWPEDIELVVLGWGPFCYICDTPSANLKMARFKVNEHCLANDDNLDNNLFCANQTCDSVGDSGSPIFWRHIQLGIVSLQADDNSCQIIYTKVSQYIEWIYSTMDLRGRSQFQIAQY